VGLGLITFDSANQVMGGTVKIFKKCAPNGG
jgi:hypothetical protein